MSRITQLILDIDGPAPLILPERRMGGYTAELNPLSVDVEMVTGRLVKELRGDVWEIKYQYGYFTEKMKNRVIEVCRRGRRKPITCEFLPPESTGERLVSRFWVMDFKQPKFYWSRPDGDGLPVPLWGDFSMALREVKPNAGA